MSQEYKQIITNNSERVNETGYVFSQRLTPFVPYSEIPDTAFWIDSVSGNFHKEESIDNVRNNVPMQTHKILNLYESLEAEKIKQSGNLDGYSGNGGWTDEYYPKVQLIYETLNASRKNGQRKGLLEVMDLLRQSGKITGDDYANVKATVPVSKVMGISPINHILKQIVSINRTDRIDQKYYKFNAPDGQIQDMGYWNIPEGVMGEYVSDTSAIAPYGYSWGVTEDYFMQSYEVDPLGDLTSLLPQRLDLFENTKIATAINALPVDTGGASFTALTGEHFTNNAYDTLEAKIIAIGTLERANPTVILSQRKHLKDYERNQTSGDPRLSRDVIGPSDMFAGIVTGVSNLDGIRWGYDSLLTTNQLTMLDPNWFIWNEGPQRLSTVVNNLTNVKQTLFKKWAGFKIVTFGISAAGSQESFRKIDTIA
jgi:hypothetical protein